MNEEASALLAPLLSLVGENIYLQALIPLILGIAAGWVFNNIIIINLKKLASKTNLIVDDHLFNLLQSPLFNSILLVGVSGSIFILAPPEPYLGISFSLIQTFAIVIWVMFLLTSNRIMLTAIARNKNRVKAVHNQTLPLFLNLINIFIVVMAVYFIFSAWHIDMTAWLASAGIVGIAVGFAAKDTLANLFSGVFIMADAPYKIGDYVVLDTLERGEITHIGIRSTRMLTRGDVEITIPNSVMGNTKIINESGGPHEKFRCSIAVGVAYGSDIDLVRSILVNIAIAEETVCADPEPRVRFRVFGASSLDFDLLVWIEKPMLRGRVVDILNTEIYHQFRDNNVEIPYSKQDLYIKELPAKE
jgi:small-conductance mechanosensitive channel